mmetsp:Transcript_1233/g.2003  ORF Transcript_1233/g.2003 Transcript_1233/m.2003 type:complete len:82 (-) Transcript_1233:28-273(-)
MIYFFGENITNEQRVKKDERKRQDPRFGAMLMREGESTDSFSDFGIEFLCFWNWSTANSVSVELLTIEAISGWVGLELYSP